MQDGSFYQYFESKEDLISYIINKHFSDAEENIRKILIKNDGNIFDTFIELYGYMIEKSSKNDMELFKQIFDGLKSSQEAIFFMHSIKEPKCPIDVFLQYEDIIDKSILNMRTREDLFNIIQILNTITFKSLALTFKATSLKEAKRNYVQQIRLLQYGLEK